MDLYLISHLLFLMLYFYLLFYLVYDKITQVLPYIHTIKHNPRNQAIVVKTVEIGTIEQSRHSPRNQRIPHTGSSSSFRQGQTKPA